jgi:hypothetical protein
LAAGLGLTGPQSTAEAVSCFMSASAGIQPTVRSMQLHRGIGLFGDHDRPNMALGGFTPKQRLAMAA